MKFKTIVACLMLMMNGCVIGYRKYPRAQLGQPAPEKQFKNVYYMIEGTSLAGGYLSIRETIKKESPFENAEERPGAPSEGIFLKVHVETISPSIGAIIAGYISYSTLTLLPSWSSRDGARVQFTLYKDGQIIKSFDYETRRFIGVWLPLLPWPGLTSLRLMNPKCSRQ